MDIFTSNLRAQRARRGWTQEEFADKAGMHRSYTGALERGEKNLTLAKLEELADALDIHMFELLLPEGYQVTPGSRSRRRE